MKAIKSCQWVVISIIVYRCHPVYCKYKFYKQPEHLTGGKEHAKNIYWDDINVVLLGK